MEYAKKNKCLIKCVAEAEKRHAPQSKTMEEWESFYEEKAKRIAEKLQERSNAEQRIRYINSKLNPNRKLILCLLLLDGPAALERIRECVDTSITPEEILLWKKRHDEFVFKMTKGLVISLVPAVILVSFGIIVLALYSPVLGILGLVVLMIAIIAGLLAGF